MTSIKPSSISTLLLQAPIAALFLQSRVCAGFPSPAEDLGASRIDLAKVLITHPQATYLMRASGLSMIELGIFDNDILVNNRSTNEDSNPLLFERALGMEGNTQPGLVLKPTLDAYGPLWTRMAGARPTWESAPTPGWRCRCQSAE